MMRSTKIVATLGPASSDITTLERMIRAGVDVVRLNFSHGTAADHEARAALVKELATKTARTVAILCDLQGPKIRVGRFVTGRCNVRLFTGGSEARCGSWRPGAGIGRRDAVVPPRQRWLEWL